MRIWDQPPTLKKLTTTTLIFWSENFLYTFLFDFKLWISGFRSRRDNLSL